MAGTAVAGTNYTTTTGTLTIPAGQTSGTISVPTIADNLVTSNLMMSVTLYSPSTNVTLGTVTGAGTIVNTTVLPGLSIGGASGNEGGTLSFPVTLSQASGQTVTAHYATNAGTAIAGSNYTTTGGTLTIVAGQTTGTINVPTIDDHLVSSNLTMSVTLSAPSVNATLGTATATGTIVNIDVAPTISIGSASANEGSALSFPVSLSAVSGSAVTVNYATAAFTAVAGTNYTTTSGTLTIPAGQTTGTISVPTIDDYLVTSSVTMSVTLSAPSSNATLGAATGTGTIANIDVTPTLSIGSASASEGSVLSFPVTLSAISGKAVTINYTTAAGTAAAAINYTTTSGTLTIPAGQTSGTISVSTIQDHAVTANLTMSATLSSPSANATLGTATGTGTIVNIDYLIAQSWTQPNWPQCYSTSVNVASLVSAVSGWTLQSVTLVSGVGSAGFTGTIVTFFPPFPNYFAETVVWTYVVKDSAGRTASGTLTVQWAHLSPPC